ncbi:peptidase M20 [Oceanospirillum linum]|uniref:Peptidase M20 n=1 Tax=Oceanospirillum linum TaxID=966 RepID=A0A1T1HGU8_OCELI|nr:peptidase M20 [Oceanospirillum linum]
MIWQATQLRHQLHQQPELTWQEKKTSQTIRHYLDQLGITWREYEDVGTLATLAPNANGPHTALRGDIDALPIHEEAQVSFASQTSGCMHACGHDGHTAALWATAAWLKAHEDQLPGPVTLIFQPAEEGGHGAKALIDAGALEGIDRIYGWHNWPAIPYGQAVCPDGTVMAGNGTFHIRVKGKGGHASQPELCRDPLLAGSAMVINLQQIISRRVAPQGAAVVSVCSFKAESAATVIPESALIEGSIRLSSPEQRQPINALIEQICQDTARTYGVEAEVEIRSRYEATVNDAQAARAFRTALKDQLGDNWQSNTPVPIMASEDFSYYLQQIPGAFALIGMAEQENYTAPCHSPHYQFNDRLLPQVVSVFARLVGAPQPKKEHI